MSAITVNVVSTLGLPESRSSARQPARATAARIATQTTRKLDTPNTVAAPDELRGSTRIRGVSGHESWAFPSAAQACAGRRERRATASAPAPSSTATIDRISANGLSPDVSTGALAGAAAVVAAGAAASPSAAASAPSPPAFWRGADARDRGHRGGVVGVRRADPARRGPVVVGLERLPDDLALLLGRGGQEREAREAVLGQLALPRDRLDAAVGGLLVLRFQPAGSSKENGSTSLGICSVTSTVVRVPLVRDDAPRRARDRPARRAAGRTWTCADAGAANASRGQDRGGESAQVT